MIVDDVVVVPFQWVVPHATGPTSVVSRRTMGERGQQEADRHPHDQHCTPSGEGENKIKKKRIKYKSQHSGNLASGKDLFPNGCISNLSHVLNDDDLHKATCSYRPISSVIGHGNKYLEDTILCLCL